jgi:ABC-type multidrug transport system ATPase subunit
MIHITGVRKRFGRFTALDGVDLRVGAGESVALWGANGAGKSTLIRCVLGLFRFDGRISVGGIDVSRDGKAARSLIGYVPQELGFYDDLRVGEAIAFFGRLKGLRRIEVDGALRGVDLVGHDRKRVRELSGGMKQRLALAIALLGDPPVLVLDEVTASLDALGRREFVGLLARLRTGGRTMLFASHRPEEIAALAGRVVVLEGGRVQRECSAAELLGPGAPASHSIKLRLDPGHVRAAMHALAAGGLVARMNGVGVIVPVGQGGKAAPLRLLVEARIPVEDFDLLTAEQARACTEGHP